MVSFRWITAPLPDDIPVRQVYGFCFDDTGRVLLRDDAGRYGLPGGKPEHGEDAPAVLARECREESQITIGKPVYLGYQEVTEDGLPPYAQLRLAVRIIDFLPREPDPDTGRAYGRLIFSELLRLKPWRRSEHHDPTLRSTDRPEVPCPCR